VEDLPASNDGPMNWRSWLRAITLDAACHQEALLRAQLKAPEDERLVLM